jgi:hypothetical protein
MGVSLGSDRFVVGCFVVICCDEEGLCCDSMIDALKRWVYPSQLRNVNYQGRQRLKCHIDIVISSELAGST